jgi:hypothetical protein
MPLRSLILLLPALAAAVDIAPPEPPNPYNTSEARTLRDVLSESFHKKVADTMPVADLRALYRKLWNADQERRSMDGEALDPTWAKAHQEEEHAQERAAMVDSLNRLGGTSDPSMTDDALRQAIAERKAASEAKAKEERTKQAEEEARKRDELSRQIEAEQKAAPPPKDRQATFVADKSHQVPMRIYAKPTDVASDDLMLTYVKENLIRPEMTAVERANVIEQGRRLVDQRSRFKAEGAEPVMVSGTGIELWMRPYASPTDPERLFYKLGLYNPTDNLLTLQSATFAFVNSARNKPQYEGHYLFFAAPAGCGNEMSFNDSLYKDPGQTFTILDCNLEFSEAFKKK